MKVADCCVSTHIIGTVEVADGSVSVRLRAL